MGPTPRRRRLCRKPLCSGKLLLGSWYGLAFAPVFIVLLAMRAVMEERMLTRALDGYPAYAARVRYRLVPYIW